MEADNSSSPLAFSYIRFSHPEQAKGDSLRRQLAGTEEYCRRNGLRLDNSLSLRDLGVSAFKGKHRTNAKNALAQFLDLARKDRIPAGSYLVIENLDRLSREDERTALRLWMDILDLKINIVQLKPETVFRHEKSDMMDIMRAIIELSRGHGESERKSERVGAAWDNKRANIQEKKITGKCPFWLRLSTDKTEFHERPECVALVRRLFDMALYNGSKSIAKLLNEEGVLSPYGRTWSNVSVLSVLRSPAVTGEFTPHEGPAGARKPIGPPIPDYYPRIIEPDLYHAAQAATERRKKQRGPRGKFVRNLFTELLRDARDGTPMHIQEKRKGDPRLVSAGAIQGQKGSKYVSFSYSVFEKAILDLLDEIDHREVLGGGEGPDLALALEGKKAGIEAQIAKLETELRGEEVAAVVRVIRQLEDESREVGRRLAEERQKAASPVAGAWGEAKSLISLLGDGPEQEERRMRLKAAIHRIISEAIVVITSKGRHRLCAIQLWFTDGNRQRSHLIHHQTARNAAPGEREHVVVCAFANVAIPEDWDLRRKSDVRKLTKLLEEIDLPSTAN